MGLTRVVGSIAVAPAALGLAVLPYVPLPVTLVLFHVAATGFVVAGAASDRVATQTQSLLGKDKEGKLRLWGKVLFWPYHVGIRVRLQMRKSVSSEPLYHEIYPGWYVGGWPDEEGALPSDEPSVVDCTCELPRMHQAKHYLCIPVWDTHGATAVQLQEGVDWALQEREKGRSVYIHCAHGHGRSVALLIACFLKLGLCGSIDEGEAKVKSMRPKIKLNARQKKEIRQWMKLENFSEKKKE